MNIDRGEKEGNGKGDVQITISLSKSSIDFLFLNCSKIIADFIRK